jgi:hypothetical protein
VATLEDLDEASLKLILTQPKNALVKQYQRLIEMEGVGLTVVEEALGAIASQTLSIGGGPVNRGRASGRAGGCSFCGMRRRRWRRGRANHSAFFCLGIHAGLPPC